MEDSKIEAYWKEKAESEFSDPFKIMDEDYDLWSLNPDSVMNSYDADVRIKTKEHGSDIKIVSNKLRLNSDRIDSSLAEAEMQLIIRMAEETGGDKRNEIGVLERLLRFALYEADRRLKRLILPPLKGTNIWYLTKRGGSATRVMVYEGKKKGTVVFNLVALDPRWLVYDVGEEEVIQLAYKTFRSASSLQSAYKYKADKPYDNPVVDYWEKEGGKRIVNKIVCKQDRLHKQVYEISSMPFTIVPVAIRPPIAGNSEQIKGYGTSIFAAVRNINAVQNRLMSMWASHANRLSRQAIINYMGDGGKRVESVYDSPGGVLNLKKDENEVKPIPTMEISPTLISLANWGRDEVQQGMLPDYRVSQPPESGTRAAMAMEAGNVVFSPQLRALSEIYEDIFRLIEEQLIEGGIKVKTTGIQANKYLEIEVKPVDLKKPHFIKVEFTSKPPWSDQATAQLSDMMLRQGFPFSWVLEHIYKVEDPKLIQDLKFLEVYDHSPIGAMEGTADALIRVRNDKKASDSLISEMDRAEQEATQLPVAPPTPPASALPPEGMM